MDITYVYDQGTDGMGRLTAMTDAAESLTFGYDAHGRLTSKTNVIDILSYKEGTSYTPGGRVNTVTYPGGRTLDYTRDYMARMEGLSTTFGGVTQPLVSGMTYNAFGGPKGLSMSSGGEVNNQSGSSCGCIEVANPGTMMERTYTYDGNKNLTGITAPNTPWYDQTFGYDALNRLETASGSYGNISYTYDGTGNRLTRDVNGVTETYDYDTTGRNRLDEITFSDASPQVVFGYDANGNTTTYGDRTLIYNENNRLVEVKEGENTIATYTYNGLGQRVKKTVGEISTYYVYDQNGKLIAETTSGATTEYLYMGKIRMAMADATSGVSYFYLNDRLGTPQLMTYGDSTTVMWEARYKPFGEAVVHPQSGVVNNFRFPGQYFDEETGFHYNYHRYYDPETGRYFRADPIGQVGGINVFAYTLNNPVNLTDVDGLRIRLGGTEEERNVLLGILSRIAGTQLKLKEDNYVLSIFSSPCEYGEIEEWVKEIINSPIKVFVEFNPIADLYGGGAFDPNTRTVHLSPEHKRTGQDKFVKGYRLNWKGILTGDFVKVLYFSQEGSLAQELLGHGLDYIRGNKKNNQSQAIRRANYVRKVLGIPLR